MVRGGVVHILILGAAGMVGRKLTQKLGRDGVLGGQTVYRLTLVDVIAPERPAIAGDCRCLALDISDPATAPALIGQRPDVIFHLAAIVSGEAEVDFDKGYAINLDGTHHLLDAIRMAHLADGYRPRVVFTSSIAVFGAPFPEVIEDDFFTTPRTSYGVQKAIGELLIGDYSRKGFLDGIALRLPTICIRPGAPNKAASGFFSNILREPLVGKPAILPVPDTVRHWHASPRAAVGFLLHAATMDLAPLGARRALSLPGLSATVAEQIEALRRIAGNAAVALIRREDDPAIRAIVDGWPQNFTARRALDLGFRADDSFDQIIQFHIQDELVGS